MPVSAISRSTSSGMARSPIDLPETLTSRRTSCSASRWIALRATHWSISWIRPKRSAVSMNAAGMTISPSSPIMRSSSSYWVIESVASSRIGWQYRTKRSSSSARRIWSAQLRRTCMPETYSPPSAVATW